MLGACERALSVPQVLPATGSRKEPRRSFTVEATLLSELGAPVMRADLHQLSSSPPESKTQKPSCSIPVRARASLSVGPSSCWRTVRTNGTASGSANHVNNFLWAYEVDTGKLARILSCPSGAESTGLQAVDDVNGFTYIMSNFQHPGDWEKGLHDKMKDATAALIDKNFRNRRSAAVGYIQGLPQQTA